MEQGDGAVEVLPKCRCARGDETHAVAADLIAAGDRVVVLGLGLREYGRRRKGQDYREKDGVLHISSLNSPLRYHGYRAKCDRMKSKSRSDETESFSPFRISTPE